MTVATQLKSSAKARVRAGLNKAGFTLLRTGPRVPVTQKHYPPGTIEELHRDIEALPLNATDWEVWTSPEAVKGYLDDHRVNFYHQLVNTALDAGVQLDGRHVLDVGTCSGYLLKVVKDRFPQSKVTGTDYYEECVRLSAALVPDAKVFQASIDDLKGTTDTYDVIFCTEVLEHIVDTETQIAAMFALVNPGGALVVTVPNGRHDTTPSISTTDGTSYAGHVNFWSPESWDFYVDRIAGDVRTARGQLGGHYVDDALYAVLFKD